MTRHVQVFAASKKEAREKVLAHYGTGTIERVYCAGITRWKGMTPIEREYHVTITTAE